MDGYVRVSRISGRAGESFLSPAVQREQIEGWAKLRGVEIAACHEDLDQSGGKLDRPGLTALLSRIEDGDTEGVVVAKLDRLSRLGVADALKLVERITDAGGSIAAVDLGLDPTTPFGGFGMTIMLPMARMERRRLSDSWEVAKARAMDRGVKIGPTPFGYLREPDGTLSEHPLEAPIVSEVYRLAAVDGLHAARAFLEQQAPNRASTTFTVRRLLATRTYLGESHYGDRMEQDAHPALTDRATWEAAQTTHVRTRRAKSTFPLSGIASCASCGGPMVGGRGGADNKRTYRCAASLTGHKGQRCSEGANIVAATLETYVQDALGEARGEARGGGAWDSGAESDVSLTDAEGALEDAETELEAFASDLTLRRALGTRYHDHLHARADAVEQAQVAYRAVAANQVRGSRVLTPELYETEDPAELRELFDAALSTVMVTRGRLPIAERVRLILHGDDELAGMPAPQDAPLGGSQPVERLLREP